MNFTKSKQIFKDWNKFKNMLLEVTEKELQVLDKTFELLANDPSDLPFGNIFGDKTRLLVPIQYDPYLEETDLSKMLKILVAGGWTIDLNTGIATKQFETEFEGVKRIQKREMKINAIWTTALNLFKKRYEIYTNYTKKAKDQAREQGKSATLLLPQLLKQDPEFQKTESQLTNLLGPVTKSYIDTPEPEIINQIQDFINTWQTEAPKIKGRLSKGSGYTMIISRHPIDVLRMSDYRNITSCHSPPSTPEGRWAGGGQYYPCAVAEARAGGAIAMLVKSDDIEGVDLEQREIFADQTRDLEGINPISRIRLKNIANLEADINLALPEKAIYGPDVVNFSDKLKSWAINTQAPQLEKLLATADSNNQIDMSEFTKFGGSYDDTPVVNIFADLIKSVPTLKDIKLTGKIQYSSRAQAQAEIDIGNELHNQAAPIILQFNENSERQGSSVLCDEQWYVEADYIYPGAYHYYDLDKSRFKLTQDYQTGLKDIDKWLKEEFSNYGYENFADSITIGYNKSEKLRLRIYFKESHFNEYGITDIQELQEYLDQVTEQYEINEQGIKEVIEYYLVREGVYEGQKLGSFNNDLLDKDFQTDWNMTADENYIMPKEIAGELQFEISYKELGTAPNFNSPQEELNFFHAIGAALNKFFPDASPDKDQYYFSSAFDVNIDDITIYLNITLYEGMKDSLVTQLMQFLQIPIQKHKDDIINFIKSYTSPSAPKTALNEFKQITNNWKKFLL